MSTPLECKESMGRGRASAFSFVSRRKDAKVAGPHLALHTWLFASFYLREHGKGSGEN